MEKPVLCNKDIFPDDTIIRNALGDSYSVYTEFFDALKQPDYHIISTWRYYNDGKSWLLKTEFKKKTLFWLSVWKGYFKVSFYFTEKNIQDVISLNINRQVTEDFLNCKPAGKLLPLVFIVKEKEQIKDILTTVNYKLKMK